MVNECTRLFAIILLGLSLLEPIQDLNLASPPLDCCVGCTGQDAVIPPMRQLTPEGNSCQFVVGRNKEHVQVEQETISWLKTMYTYCSIYSYTK